VKRHDYRRRPFDAVRSAIGTNVAWPTLRAPAALAGAVLVLLAAGWSIEAQRIGALDRELDMLQTRAGVAGVEAAAAQRLSAAIARDRAFENRILDARRATIASSNAVALIGNTLPAQTWLTNVSATPTGSWTIAGRSTHVSEIGTTLHAIQQLDRRAPAHLVSIAATGRNGDVLDFIIGWDRQP